MQGVSKSGTATVKTATGEHCQLKLGEIDELPRGLGIELIPVDPDESGRASEWRVRAEVAADAPLGAQSVYLPIQSSVQIPGEPAGTFFTTGAPVSYVVRGPLEASMQYVSFGLVRGGKALTRQVRLTRHDASVDFASLVAEVTVEPNDKREWKPKIKTKFAPVPGSPNAMELTLEWPAAPAGTSCVVRGSVRVTTGQPNVADVSIRFSGVVR